MIEQGWYLDKRTNQYYPKDTLFVPMPKHERDEIANEAHKIVRWIGPDGECGHLAELDISDGRHVYVK